MYLYNSECDEDAKVERHKIMKDFGNNIKMKRRKRKLTQEKMAEIAGINPKYLGEIERGIKNPTVTVAQSLAAALGVPVCELLSKEHCPMKVT